MLTLLGRRRDPRRRRRRGEGAGVVEGGDLAAGLGDGAAPVPRTKPRRRRKAAKDDDGSQGTLL